MSRGDLFLQNQFDLNFSIEYNQTLYFEIINRLITVSVTLALININNKQDWG